MYGLFILLLGGRARLWRIRRKQKRRLNMWHAAFSAAGCRTTWQAAVTAGWWRPVFVFFFLQAINCCLSSVLRTGVSMWCRLCLHPPQVPCEPNYLQMCSANHKKMFGMCLHLEIPWHFPSLDNLSIYRLLFNTKWKLTSISFSESNSRETSPCWKKKKQPSTIMQTLCKFHTWDSLSITSFAFFRTVPWHSKTWLTTTTPPLVETTCQTTAELPFVRYQLGGLM